MDTNLPTRKGAAETANQPSNFSRITTTLNYIRWHPYAAFRSGIRSTASGLASGASRLVTLAQSATDDGAFNRRIAVLMAKKSGTPLPETVQADKATTVVEGKAKTANGWLQRQGEKIAGWHNYANETVKDWASTKNNIWVHLSLNLLKKTGKAGVWCVKRMANNYPPLLYPVYALAYPVRRAIEWKIVANKGSYSDRLKALWRLTNIGWSESLPAKILYVALNSVFLWNTVPHATNLMWTAGDIGLDYSTRQTTPGVLVKSVEHLSRPDAGRHYRALIIGHKIAPDCTTKPVSFVGERNWRLLNFDIQGLTAGINPGQIFIMRSYGTPPEGRGIGWASTLSIAGYIDPYASLVQVWPQDDFLCTRPDGTKLNAEGMRKVLGQ